MLFGTKRVQPARVPSDTVIPLYYWDNTAIYKSFVLTSCFRFDDVLDPEKLRTALEKLGELGDWKKLGARLRLNDRGKLEYHIPDHYDAKRPAFLFSHDVHNTNLVDHPIARDLPKASEKPSMQASPKKFEALTLRSDAPRTWEDYIYSDQPQISAHVVSFDDATLLSFTWGHWILDAMGKAAFLNAFQLVLNGQEEQVPAFRGFDFDPMEDFGVQVPPVKHVLADKIVKGFGFYSFVLRYLWAQIVPWKTVWHTVCLPASSLKAMREKALKELAVQQSGDETPFLSDGDVICAWSCQFALRHFSPRSNRSVSLLVPMDLRTRIGEDRFPSGTAYASGNAVLAAYIILPAREILQKSLGFVASQIRKAIKEQGSHEQLEAMAHTTREHMNKTSRPPIFGDSTTHLQGFTNWSKAKFFDLDLSAAVIREGFPVKDRTNLLGRPSYFQALSNNPLQSSRYMTALFGKDAAGSYWLISDLPASTWKKMEAEFAKD